MGKQCRFKTFCRGKECLFVCTLYKKNPKKEFKIRVSLRFIYVIHHCNMLSVFIKLFCHYNNPSHKCTLLQNSFYLKHHSLFLHYPLNSMSDFSLLLIIPKCFQDVPML